MESESNDDPSTALASADAVQRLTAINVELMQTKAEVLPFVKQLNAWAAQIAVLLLDVNRQLMQLRLEASERTPRPVADQSGARPLDDGSNEES